MPTIGRRRSPAALMRSPASTPSPPAKSGSASETAYSIQKYAIRGMRDGFIVTRSWVAILSRTGGKIPGGEANGSGAAAARATADPRGGARGPGRPGEPILGPRPVAQRRLPRRRPGERGPGHRADPRAQPVSRRGRAPPRRRRRLDLPRRRARRPHRRERRRDPLREDGSGEPGAAPRLARRRRRLDDVSELEKWQLRTAAGAAVVAGADAHDGLVGDRLAAAPAGRRPVDLAHPERQPRRNRAPALPPPFVGR